jgi:hypothetical protein
MATTTKHPTLDPVPQQPTDSKPQHSTKTETKEDKDIKAAYRRKDRLALEAQSNNRMDLTAIGHVAK